MRIIYGMKGCHLCKEALAKAIEEKVEYVYIDVGTDENAMAKMRELKVEYMPYVEEI